MNEYVIGSYLPKKNSQIHLRLETELHIKLKKQAADKYLSISELCRQKIRNNPQLDRIESMLNRLMKEE